jgi:tricorn protease
MVVGSHPINAVFDPVNNKWIAENTGIAPDIEVRQMFIFIEGVDPQRTSGKEVLKMVEQKEEIKLNILYPAPAKN